MAKRTSRVTETHSRRMLRRGAIIAGVIVVAAFLVEGGEWGTVDVLKQRTRFAKLKSEVEQLEREVDSLRVDYRLLRTDRARLERVAREEFGMVRGEKEILYKVRDAGAADSAAIRKSS